MWLGMQQYLKKRLNSLKGLIIEEKTKPDYKTFKQTNSCKCTQHHSLQNKMVQSQPSAFAVVVCSFLVQCKLVIAVVLGVPTPHDQCKCMKGITRLLDRKLKVGLVKVCVVYLFLMQGAGIRVQYGAEVNGQKDCRDDFVRLQVISPLWSYYLGNYWTEILYRYFCSPQHESLWL